MKELWGVTVTGAAGENNSSFYYSWLLHPEMKTLGRLLDTFWQWRMTQTPEFASLAGCPGHDNLLEEWTEGRFNKVRQTKLEKLRLYPSTSYTHHWHELVK